MKAFRKYLSMPLVALGTCALTLGLLILVGTKKTRELLTLYRTTTRIVTLQWRQKEGPGQ